MTVGLCTADRARTLHEPICDIYDAVFSVAPFVWTDAESAHHRSMLNRLIADPSFGIAVAMSGNTLVGFAYGYALTKPDWWAGFRDPVPDYLIREWPGRTFALIDLAVQPEWRRRGIGRRLVDCLLASRTEERATLAAQPQAEVSHRFYAALGGWINVGRQNTPGFVSPRFDIYVRKLEKP